MVREWWLVCVGLSDPCLCSDGIPSTPLHLMALALSSALLGFLCCILFEGNLSVKCAFFRRATLPRDEKQGGTTKLTM